MPNMNEVAVRLATSLPLSNLEWRDLHSQLTQENNLTHKQMETFGCILSTEATNAMLLKHEATSTYSDNIVCYGPVSLEILELKEMMLEK